MARQSRGLFARLRRYSLAGRRADRRLRQISDAAPGVMPAPSLLNRFNGPQPKIYGRVGSLEVRLACGLRDLRRAQRLRYKVFYEEMSATPSAAAKRSRRDEDAFDAVCDHLLVVDTSPVAKAAQPWRSNRRSRVVGTYRVLRQDMLADGETFYTQSEYDLRKLLADRQGTHKFMELGRSCVLPPYRNKRTVELLWHGLWTYCREHNIAAMMGCASFEGTDPAAHAEALSFLHHERRAPSEWCVRAHDDLYVDMNMMARDAVNPKRALKALPPLIKGYLRVGAYVGDGAVIDHQFGTTDVFIILPVEAIDPRYFGHFGAPDERESRIAVEKVPAE
ncbi:MAG: GNAT family N-acyltransferase [Pseudomonadota bacterium]